MTIETVIGAWLPAPNIVMERALSRSSGDVRLVVVEI
jgi:hypothetical protein